MKSQKIEANDDEDLDEIYDKYKDLDFSNAKRAHEVPHLAQHQRETAGKKTVTIRIDAAVLAAFKQRATASGVGYQTLINKHLEAVLDADRIESIVRQAIREELARVK